MIETENLISFRDAPRVIPGRPALSQVYRWAMRGLRGVRLEWMQVGGRRYTSREALSRFYAATTTAAGGESADRYPPSKTRKMEIVAAERELASAGFDIGGDDAKAASSPLK